MISKVIYDQIRVFIRRSKGTWNFTFLGSKITNIKTIPQKTANILNKKKALSKWELTLCSRTQTLIGHGREKRLMFVPGVNKIYSLISSYRTLANIMVELMKKLVAYCLIWKRTKIWRQIRVNIDQNKLPFFIWLCL